MVIHEGHNAIPQEKAQSILNEWATLAKTGCVRIRKGFYKDYNKSCHSYHLESVKDKKDISSAFGLASGTKYNYPELANIYHWKDTRWSNETRRHEDIHTFGVFYDHGFELWKEILK